MKKLIWSQGNSDTDENNDSHIVFRRNKTDTRFDVDEFSDHNRQYRNRKYLLKFVCVYTFLIFEANFQLSKYY